MDDVTLTFTDAQYLALVKAIPCIEALALESAEPLATALVDVIGIIRVVP